MKWWQILLLILAFLILVRVIVYAVTLNAVTKLAASDPAFLVPASTNSSLEAFNNFNK